MIVAHFHDERTWTLTYVVHDDRARIGIVIDSVTDYDPKSGRTWNETNDRIAAYVDDHGLEIAYVLDTHAHADHLTGMPFFKERYRARTVIGSRIRVVQERFRQVFNLGAEFATDGRQFDCLVVDEEVLQAGPLRIRALHSPGHTPACMCYLIGDALFVGDTLFMPDYGVGRCDFPGGSAAELYDSIHRLYRLPDETRVFTGHDYRPGGRPLRWESTIREEKALNVQIPEHRPRAEFITARKQRDATLEMPALIFPAIQVNIRAGRLPPPESNGVSYLKIPLNFL
jgi:glyoxylase-like metal-dependent hydrolase (beta-lactamase superfamily II)